MGILRLFLALSVVSAHAQSRVFGFPPVDADMAVNFFFIISGFYMAMVLNGKYRDAPLRSFYLNRVVRLFPVYLLGTAIALILTFGTVAAFFATLRGWGPAYFVLTNIGIIGQDLSYLICVPTSAGCSAPVPLTLNPPAWSLSIELGFYAIAPFIVRSAKRTYAFICIGLVYLFVATLVSPTVFAPLTAVPHLAPQSQVDFSYYFYPASFLFFGLGALARLIASGQARFRYWPILALVVAATFTPMSMEFWLPFVFAAVVPVLFRLTASNRVDRTIGELSYPVYILHFPAIYALQATLPKGSPLLLPEWFGTVLGVVCIAAGLLVHFTIETAVTRFRHSLVRHVPPDRLKRTIPIGPAVLLSGYVAVPVLVMVWVLTHQVPVPPA